jgi:hydrogenase maturation protease
MAPIKRVVIVGIGNSYRGDDDAGLAVIRALEARALPDAVSLTHADDPLMLIDLLASAPALLVIDAISAADSPGTIHRFDASTQRLPIEFSSCSTHAFGVAEAVELARVLSSFPRHIAVYGIVGQRFGVGDTLSPEVERAVQRVADALMDEINVLAGCRSTGLIDRPAAARTVRRGYRRRVKQIR